MAEVRKSLKKKEKEKETASNVLYVTEVSKQTMTTTVTKIKDRILINLT